MIQRGHLKGQSVGSYFADELSLVCSTNKSLFTVRIQIKKHSKVIRLMCLNPDCPSSTRTIIDLIQREET